jgi:hypothetical protein
MISLFGNAGFTIINRACLGKGIVAARTKAQLERQT